MPQEIRAFFERYREAFNALDGEAVAALYAEPSGIAQDAVYTHWSNRQAVSENMRALCQLYAGQGFVAAEFEPSRFIEQGVFSNSGMSLERPEIDDAERVDPLAAAGS